MQIPRILSLLSLCSLAVSPLAASSYLWLEQPQQTNFPDTPRWDILTEQRAPAVMNVKDASKADSYYIEYVFTVPAPGGRYQLWGRNYDPNWSSPARWKIDGGQWRTWQPGASVNRQVALKTFAMHWNPWTQEAELELTPGEHTLRLELTGLRPRGDIPFFVLDALLLTRGKFSPAGAEGPEQVVAREVGEIRVLAATGGGGRKDEFVAQADAIGARALGEDLGAIADFAALREDIAREGERGAIIAKNSRSALHGKITDIALSEQSGELTFKATWNRNWQGTPLWVGFTQGRALYGWQLLDAPAAGREQTYSVRLPENLPAGIVTLTLVPVDQPSAATAQSTFTVSQERAAARPQPYSWGIYRDSNLRVHPWSINEAGMMLWDGKPYVPVGGMINARMSWRTNKGDVENSDVVRSGQELLRAQFEKLASYGLRDVYFNAFFLRSDPTALAATVNLAEEMQMRYGLHISSVPANRSLGYHAQKPLPVAAGQREQEIRLSIPQAEVRPQHRVIWALLTDAGQVLDKGQGVLAVQPTADARKKNHADLVFTARFKAPRQDAQLVFTPELIGNNQDVVSYFPGLEDFIASIRESYGSIAYGPGMRLWVDPFQNELHARPVAVYLEPAVRRYYESWLQKRYGSVANLNAAWQPAQGSALTSFAQATRLVPLFLGADAVRWVDSDDLSVYTFAGSGNGAASLRDHKLYRGELAQELISRVADVLKSIADVPVVLKHNTFFNDWFINPAESGGQDGIGYEPYCYGDSLAYHNSLVPYAQAVTSRRMPWTIVTETSPAAFDGQKDYVGYLDRLQLLNDFDQLLKFGAKGFYTFGFAFDPPRNFQITELLRDPRQLEWLGTYHKTLEAAPGLAGYRPEVYGWYPAYLRELEIVSAEPPLYSMHGNYSQRVAQIRMAPDGRWIVPAMHLDADWKGVLAATNLLTQPERFALQAADSQFPVWKLGSDLAAQAGLPALTAQAPLNGFTANGIGVISPAQPWLTLDEFREQVLGYRVFRTRGINGQTLPDGRLMIWTPVELERSLVTLPVSAKAFSLSGEPLQMQLAAGGNRRVLTLVREQPERRTADLPAYLRHLPGGYYYADNGQPEVAIIEGVSVDEFVALHEPQWQRWLPAAVAAGDVALWQEAEDFEATSFVQPRIEGYSRYSGKGGAAIGMNTFFTPPAGQQWQTSYRVRTEAPARSFWLRRMDKPAMDLEIRIDGRAVGVIPATQQQSDAMHLQPWNAGIGLNKMNVGWHKVELPSALSAGEHRIQIVAQPAGSMVLKADTQLLGGQSDAQMEEQAANITGLQCVQIDAFMLVR